MPFFFIFKHSQALNRSWKIFHGVLESPGFFGDCYSLSVVWSFQRVSFVQPIQPVYVRVIESIPCVVLCVGVGSGSAESVGRRERHCRWSCRPDVPHVWPAAAEHCLDRTRSDADQSFQPDSVWLRRRRRSRTATGPSVCLSATSWVFSSHQCPLPDEDDRMYSMLLLLLLVVVVLF